MFCRTHFNIPPRHSNILTDVKDFVIVFAVSFLNFLATSLQSIVDYELLAILLPDNTKNKCNLATGIFMRIYVTNNGVRVNCLCSVRF
jgi:hypothetical protein